MSLGGKVKEAREKRGMNQAQLAEASGISQATISRIESGKVKELRSQALRRLGEALGVTVDYLVDKTDRLSSNDIVLSDATAQYIIRVYEKLSDARRWQLRDFVRFLEHQEAGEKTPDIVGREVPTRQEQVRLGSILDQARQFRQFKKEHELTDEQMEAVFRQLPILSGLLSRVAQLMPDLAPLADEQEERPTKDKRPSAPG